MTHREIEDLALSDEWDIIFGHRGDLSVVSGREAFEQEISIRLQRNIGRVIGRFSNETVKDLAELSISRVADEMELIDSVAEYSAEISGTTLTVEVIFDSGEALTFEHTP